MQPSSTVCFFVRSFSKLALLSSHLWGARSKIASRMTGWYLLHGPRPRPHVHTVFFCMMETGSCPRPVPLFPCPPLPPSCFGELSRPQIIDRHSAAHTAGGCETCFFAQLCGTGGRMMAPPSTGGGSAASGTERTGPDRTEGEREHHEEMPMDDDQVTCSFLFFLAPKQS